MKVQKYLSLCDPHNSIIHEFGSDNSCAKVASICLKGCNQHDHILKNSKHEFINSRQFYSIVQELRQKYKTFKINFRQVYLKNYLSMAYNLLDSFQDHVNSQYLQRTPLLDIFCKYSAQKDVFQMLIEQKFSQMEFSELKCKEINLVRNFHKAITKQTKEDQEKRMIKLLSKILEHFLVGNKLLSNDKNATKTSHQVLKEDNLIKVYKQIEGKLKNYQLARNQFRITNLIIKIKEQDETIQQNFNNEEFCTRFSQKFKKYVEKTHTENVELSCNLSLTPNKFWQKLFATLSSQTYLKNFTLVTSLKDTEKCKFFQDYFKKQLNLPFQLNAQSNFKNQQPVKQQTSTKTTTT